MSNRIRRAAIAIVSILWASVAAAQAPVLNPRFLEFNASADHSANASTGEPLVTRYDLEFYNIGAPSPFQTNSLNKPAPNASGVIRIDLTTTFAALPTGTTFESRVVAVGPGGIGRSGVSNQFAFTAPCTVTLMPTGTSAGAAASTGSVSVSTGAGCAWTAASNAAWVTISSGASGTGNGTVNYSIAANTAPTARNAALTIGGQTFNISQAAGCTYAISPSSLSVTSDARNGTVSVTAGTGCAWTAASSASWITVTSGASGSGNGSVGYSIAANTTISSRAGTVTIAGQAFTVTQAGILCTATISPTGVSVAAASATGNIAVSIPTGCVWTAVDDASWVSITSGASGNGNGTVAYSIAANPDTTQRTATIAIGGQFFGITQAGTVCSTTISPTASSPTSAGGAGTVAVTASAGSCAWTAASNAAWITITAGASGTGNGSVSYNVAANALTSSRTGTMTIAGQTMTVTQAGAPCTYAISPTVASLGPAASTNTIAVTAPAGCAWTTSESATWISITGGASGSGNGTVTYSVTANPTITARNATMTIAGQSFDVTQAGQPCTYTLTPAGASVVATASTGSVAVAALGGCAWTATSSAAWVTITSGASGSGNGTVGYSVAANGTTSPRTGTLTIGGQPFTITQAGGTCTYTASPAAQSFTDSGGPGTITLTTLAGCAWSATTSAPWVTINGTGTGNGSGTIGYTVAANPVATSRNGTIAVGGQVVTISQDPAPCSYTLSPASVSVTSDAASGTFSMAATAGCSWTATSGAPWLTVTSGASGSGNGTTGYSVAANPNTTLRTGTITAGGQTFTVTQAAVVCSTTISPTASSPTSAGGAGTVAVTASAGSCAWTAASNAAWITITAGANGSGSGTVDYTVAANTSTTGRTGTMTIAGQTMTVTQAGAPCNYAISPTVATLGPEAGANSVAVTASAGCAWTASESASWITITGGASGSGNGTVTYTVSANPAVTARNATMTIAGQNFDVTQAGQTCTYTLTPAGASVGAAASTGSVAVGALGGCAWTATSPDAWVTITSGASGTGDGSVGYSVAANTATTPRTATLTIGGQPFTITQAAAACTYTATPATHSFPASGGPGTVTLTTQAGCAWNATTSAPWITISGTGGGTGSGAVDFAVVENPDGLGRSGTIAIGAQIVTVSQAAAACTYTFSPASVSVGSDVATGSFSVAANNGCAWTASSSAPWLTVTSAPSGSGNGTVSYSVDANPATAQRSATISVGTGTFNVTQAPAACTYTLSSTSLSVASAVSTGSISVTSITGCAWTAVSADSWITVSGGATGTGNGTVSLSIAANPGSTPRTGSLTIAGQTVTVTQHGGACTTTISPTSVSAPGTLTTGTVSVASPAGCAWTAASNTAWITIDSGATGTGPGAVTYTIAANTVTTPRTGSLTIGGQTFDVSQSGRSCLATFNPSSASIGAAGGGFTVDVQITAGCSWIAGTSQSWISITGGTGTGPGTIGFTVQPNVSEFVRNGVISIVGRIFNITQLGNCTYSMSPLSVSTGPGAGTSSVFVSAAPACSWAATSNDPWITVTAGQSDTGIGTVSLSATANNTGSPRTGTVTIAGQTFTWTQNACSYSLSPTTTSVSANGTTSNAFVSTTSTCGWSASSDVPWITMPNGNTGTGGSWLGYTVAPNPDPTPRSGILTVAGQTLTVNQAAAACTFTVTPTEIEDIPKGGGTATVTVEASAGCSWTVQNPLSWVTNTPVQGSGNGTVTLQIAPNPQAFPRTATITVAGELIFLRQLDVDGLAAPANPRVVVQ